MGLVLIWQTRSVYFSLFRGTCIFLERYKQDLLDFEPNPQTNTYTCIKNNFYGNTTIVMEQLQ